MSRQADRAVVPALRGRARAFTLVELLVVIGIIALLVSILMPALSRAREAGKQTVCLSNLKNIGNAMNMYLQENHNYYPGHVHLDNHGVWAAIWPVRLRRYMAGNQMVFWCPDQPASYQWPVFQTGQTVAEPAQLEDGQYGYTDGEQLLDVFKVQFSYGWNDWGCGNAQPAPNNQSQRGFGGDIATNGMAAASQCHERLATQVKNSAECIVITDKYSNGNWNFNIDPTDPTQCPAAIHSQGSNCLFADGHAQWMQEQSVVVFNVRTLAAYAKGSLQWNNVSPLWNTDDMP